MNLPPKGDAATNLQQPIDAAAGAAELAGAQVYTLDIWHLHAI